MNASILYILIAIFVLAVIAVLAIFVSRNQGAKTLTPLAGLAFGFVVAGIFFGGERILGYGLLGVGLLLAVIDMVRKSRNN